MENEWEEKGEKNNTLKPTPSSPGIVPLLILNSNLPSQPNPILVTYDKKTKKIK